MSNFANKTMTEIIDLKEKTIMVYAGSPSEAVKIARW